jgi:hypothetical protein
VKRMWTKFCIRKLHEWNEVCSVGHVYIIGASKYYCGDMQDFLNGFLLRHKFVVW